MQWTVAVLRDRLKRHDNRAVSNLSYADALIQCAHAKVITESEFDEAKSHAKGKAVKAVQNLTFPLPEEASSLGATSDGASTSQQASTSDGASTSGASKKAVVVGCTVDTLKDKLRRHKELLRQQGRNDAAKKVKLDGNHAVLAQQCHELGLISAAERDAPIPRKNRAEKMADETRGMLSKHVGAGKPPVVVTVTRWDKVAKSTPEALVSGGLITDAATRMHSLSMRATHLVRRWAIANPGRFDELFGAEMYRAALEACSSDGVLVVDGADTTMSKMRSEFSSLATTLFNDSGPSKHRLTQVFRLEADRLAANALTNIKEHFVGHVKRFVNQVFDVKGQVRAARTSAAKRAISQKYGAAKAALLAIKPVDDCERELQPWVTTWKSKMPTGPYKEGSMAYDVHARPKAYFGALVAMSGELERLQKKQFQVLPLRLSNMPGHITFDTTALCDVLGVSCPHPLTHVSKMDVWSRVFQIQDATMGDHDDQCPTEALRTPFLKPFRRGKRYQPTYIFRGQVATDGVALSITLVRVDLHDLSSKDGAWKQASRAPTTTLCGVEDLETDAGGFVGRLGQREPVVVDPGSLDLHFCRSLDGKRTLRCTRAQRSRMMKIKRYNELRRQAHEHAGSLNGRTVQQWDAYLAESSSRTVDPSRFEEWTRRKMACAVATYGHWQQRLFRRLKFNAKINGRRHQDMYVRRFEETFGDPSRAVVVIGDWSKGTTHLKHSPPTLRRGLIGALRRRGYDVWLLREFRTTKSCSSCHIGDCSHCLSWTTHRGKRVVVHNLIECDHCYTYHNRNANATSNMLRIVKAVIAGVPRPTDLCRQ